MPLSPAYGSSRGGGGLLLRTPPDEFTAAARAGAGGAEAARDAAITNVPAELAAFTANPNLAIILTITGTDPDTTVYQVRRGNAWADVTQVVRGPIGPQGPQQTAAAIAAALDAFIGDAEWRSRLSGMALVDAIDAAVGSNIWRTSHTALRTAQQVRDLLDGLLGTGWRTGGGGGTGGITAEQATDAAGALLATLARFTYNAATNTLAFSLGANSVTAAEARASSDAHKTEWRTRIAAAAASDLAGYAALTGATFTGAVAGIDPSADAHFTTRSYVNTVVRHGGEPTTSDDIYFGLSDDAVPQPAEATIPAMNGSAVIEAFADKHMLIFRLASEPDIVSVLFSDDASRTNQIGAFVKQAATVIPQGETEQFNVWVSRQLLTQPDRATVTVR